MMALRLMAKRIQIQNGGAAAVVVTFAELLAVVYSYLHLLYKRTKHKVRYLLKYLNTTYYTQMCTSANAGEHTHSYKHTLTH